MFSLTRGLPVVMKAEQIVSCSVRVMTLSTPIAVINEAIKLILWGGDVLVSAHIPGAEFFTNPIFAYFYCVTHDFKDKLIK